MKRLFKYPLSGEVLLPRGAEVLDVQVQRDALVLWALVDESAPMEKRWFSIRGTGELVPDGMRHITTYQTLDGFVWHIFEERNK